MSVVLIAPPNTHVDASNVLCDTLVMPRHRRQLKRIEAPGHIRYLTCSCYRRLPLFNNDRIKQAFVDQLALVRQRLDFELYAWVVMPEHFHLLIRPTPSTRTPCPRGLGSRCGTQSAVTVTDVLRALKRPFAKRVLDRWRSLNAPILGRITDARGHAHFWQRGGGYDRNLFNPAEVFEKIDYIHDNPRRRGLVERAIDWPWSSMQWYEARAGFIMDPLPM